MRAALGVATAIATGTLCGAVVSMGVGYLWLLFGADPEKDPLLSW